MLGEEQQAIQTNRTQIGFGTHLERGKKAATKKHPLQSSRNHFSLGSIGKLLE